MSVSFGRKVAIIGSGKVGSTTAFALATQGLVDELVLIDANEKKAEGDALDLEDAMAGLPVQITVWANDYARAADCDIVIVAVGSLPTPDQTRLDTLDEAKTIIDEIVPKLLTHGFSGIFVNITNPCDVVTHYIWKKSGFPAQKVIGTGTGLDSYRLRKLLGKLFDVAPASIEGYSMGEHGDSQMVPWSHIHVGGKPVLDVIAGNAKYCMIDLKELTRLVAFAGWEVLLRKGGTYFGIATVAADLVRAIFNNENRIIPVSALLTGQYGLSDLHIGVPAIIGASGVRDVVELTLSRDERAAFVNSATVIKSYIKKLI